MRTFICLSFLLLAATAFAKDPAQPNKKLCAVKTVYIEGITGEASGLRNSITARTSLQLETVRSEADAIMLVEVSKEPSALRPGVRTYITGNLMAPDLDELLWSHTHSPDGFSSIENFWKQWNKDTKACPK